MKYVFYAASLPQSFEEQSYLSRDLPFAIKVVHYPLGEQVPLHYSKTMEITLSDGLQGEFFVDSKSYSFSGRQVFLIPPHAVHSVKIQPGDGVQYVVKIDFDMLKNYVDINALFRHNSSSLAVLPHSFPDSKALFELVENMIFEKDPDIFFAIEHITKLFRILAPYAAAKPENEIQESNFLRKLISWTEQNYHRKITVEDAASATGYSKYYFCAIFKSLTGITYFNFLKNTRLSHACSFLQQGKSVSETGYCCGFENISHFIQSFKHTYGMTPQKYAKSFSLQQKVSHDIASSL